MYIFTGCLSGGDKKAPFYQLLLSVNMFIARGSSANKKILVGFLRGEEVMKHCAKEIRLKMRILMTCKYSIAILQQPSSLLSMLPRIIY